MRTPRAAAAAQGGAAKATPRSPSLSAGDNAGSVASSKKQLQFKTPRAGAAPGGVASKSSAKKRPLAIQEEVDEPVPKKGKTPVKVSKKVLCSAGISAAVLQCEGQVSSARSSVAEEFGCAPRPPAST